MLKSKTLLLLLCLSFSRMSLAAANLELWPIVQSLDAGSTRSLLWLKNLNNQSVSLQVRVFSWTQKNNDDIYSSQMDIYPVPPFLVISPHQQIDVRFFLRQPQLQNNAKETAYRVVIDELPVPNQVQLTDSKNIKFKMRYVLPLFIYGNQMNKAYLPGINGLPKEPHRLQWDVKKCNQGECLYVTNLSQTHIRLLSIRIQDSNKRILFKDNTQSISYILPGSTVYWPLPEHLVLNHQDQLLLEEPYGLVEKFSYSLK